jgi:hypothetical protein
VITATVIDQAAMTVIGILAQADVSNDDHIRQLGFDGTNSARHDTVKVEVLQADGILVGRDSEQDNGANAEGRGPARLRHGAID